MTSFWLGVALVVVTLYVIEIAVAGLNWDDPHSGEQQ